MTSVYDSIERTAEFEAAYEKGLSIIDIERLTLPVVVNHFDLDVGLLFPKWLHVLMPVGMLEDEQPARHDHRRRHGRQRDTR